MARSPGNCFTAPHEQRCHAVHLPMSLPPPRERGLERTPYAEVRLQARTYWLTESDCYCRCRHRGSRSQDLKSAPRRWRPPNSTSSPALSMMTSSPAPPSTVSLITPACSLGASSASSPPSKVMRSVSLAPSEPVMFTRAGRPTTATPMGSPAIDTESTPSVVLTTTESIWPSPLPALDARLRSTSRVSLLCRLLTVIVSTPPGAGTPGEISPLRTRRGVAV